MTITPLNSSNLNTAELATFFKDYPFEKFYTLNLKLDTNQFNTFLVDKIVRRIENNANLWQVRNDETLIAIFGLDEERMSPNYEKKIYHLGSYYNFSSHAKEAFLLINEHIAQFSKDKSIEMVRCKIDAEDHVNIAYLLSEHYHFNASSCKMYYDVNSLGIPKAIVKHRYRVRQYETTDEATVLSILGQHKKNELYYNLDLPIDKTTKLFDDYFLKQSKANPSSSLVLEDLINKKVVGVSLHAEPKTFNSKLKKTLITWDLIVIDQNERGNGLGNLFFSHLMCEQKCDIELSTMSDNLQMLKFLHKLGFYKVGEFNFLYKTFS